MTLQTNPCFFSSEPLDRASAQRVDADFVAAKLKDPDSLLLPLYRGDPLVADDAVAWLSAAALPEFGRSAHTVFLGLAGDQAYFAVDSGAAPSPELAPFADFGAYLPLREAAGVLEERDLSLIGQARWLFEWHHKHGYCARCGGETMLTEGGAKRVCGTCGAEHFPRTDPVAIVLAIHDDACLLGRGPHFPPGVLSALAGFVEAAETPEECAVRELREEAGVVLTDVRYQFSQPWPFPSSLMMGFMAKAENRDLVLDEKEIAEARWVERDEAKGLLAGTGTREIYLPPAFTIARKLIEKWALD